MVKSKSDPWNGFPIEFWPKKKKKVVPSYLLNCQSYPQKTKFSNFWILFSNVIDHVLCIHKPKTKPNISICLLLRGAPTKTVYIVTYSIVVYIVTYPNVFQHCNIVFVNFWKLPKNWRSIFYQMDHTWWAANRPKKSPGLKMRSQYTHTLYHSSWPCRYLYDTTLWNRWDWRGV